MVLSKQKKDDFISWDDLDLDFYLGGDYTDEENEEYDEIISDIDPDDGDVDEPQPPKKKCRNSSKSPKDSEKTKYVFECPVCKKCLKTVPGFRGHVTKQHDQPLLKGTFFV